MSLVLPLADGSLFTYQHASSSQGGCGKLSRNWAQNLQFCDLAYKAQRLRVIHCMKTQCKETLALQSRIKNLVIPKMDALKGVS